MEVEKATAARDALEKRVEELVRASRALHGTLAALARVAEEGSDSRARAASPAIAGGAEPTTPVVVLLETALDCLLSALGVDVGAVWLGRYRVSRGLPEWGRSIGEAVRTAGLSIPSVQAVPDWEAADETHPELAPLADVMRSLGIRASIAVSLHQKGYGGGLAVAAPVPRAWADTEIAFVENVANVLRVAAIHSVMGEKWQESEERYRQLFDSVDSGVAVYEAVGEGEDFVVRDFNRAAERIEGVSKENLLGRSVTRVLPWVGESGLVEVFRRVWKTGKPERHLVALHKDARPESWQENYVYKLPSGEIVAVYNDVTEGKRMEEEISRVNRALKVLSKCNELVVRVADETTLLREVCRLLVEDGGYRMAWVGFASQDAARTVRPVAQAGFEEGYLDMVNITWDDSEHGRGPTGTAIRTGQPAVVRNILTDPAYALWREEATRRGYASVIALPLAAGGQAFGALNVYATEADAFGPAEMELMCKLADNLAFGMQAPRARTALRESEARYRNLVEQASDGIFLADAQGRFIDVNPRGCAMLGYTRDEILQLSIHNLLLPDDQADYAIRLGELRAGKTILIERQLIRKDGLPVPVEISAKMLPSGLLQGIVRDVTERKRMEGEIRRQAARAEALVRIA